MSMRILTIAGTIAVSGLLVGCQSQSGSSSHLALASVADDLRTEQSVSTEDQAKREELRQQMLEAQKRRDEEARKLAEAKEEERKAKLEEIRNRARSQVGVNFAKTDTKEAATTGKPEVVKTSTRKVVKSSKRRVARKSEAELKKGGRYNSLIAKYAAAEGVPVKLAHAVVRVESSYRPNARGSVGEIGLMQIRLGTARMMGYKGTAKQLYHPATNLKWGMKYLGKARQLANGDTCGTILRYNAGHGAKRMNKVSSKYCGRVKRILRS